MKNNKFTSKKLISAICILTLAMPFTSLADVGDTEVNTATEAAPVAETAPAAEVGPGVNLAPDSNTATETPFGPGYTAQPPVEVPPAIMDSNNYFLNDLENPVVLPHERYSYDQISQDLQTLKERYGSHMTLSSIGKSLDNRELYTVVVGNPNAPKHVMIQGGIHGREYITSQLMMKQLEYILAFYETGTYNGQSLSGMLDQVAVHFIPMINPDGISISQWGEGGIGSAELRQTVQNCYQSDLALGRTSAPYDQYLRSWKANARGVDLNYSFDTDWNANGKGTAAPSSSGFKGTNPLSEPESAALASYVQNFNFRAVINYHAMGQVIYWDTAANQQRDASLQLAQLLSQSTGYRILNSLGSLGFKDWVQSKSPAIPSVTLEVGRSACPVSISEFPEIWNLNRQCVAQVMDYAVKSE